MPLVIGTAGHIDHGKTALVRALTGQDTDRLKEEKERGISIDLGFAYFDVPGGERVGVVDVPGHERFIRNMLAGVHGIDLVLFVVAADDGVMPQTEEHLDILHLLGVRRGVFVITKIDLVDAARVAAVREEVEILALDTTLEGAPVVAVSTLTGEGLAALRDEIARQLAVTRVAPRAGYFRLPVDRAFVIHGHGVVVTGTAVAGTLADGDAVRILPDGITARVRGLEVHGTAVPRVAYGQRVAVNLAGVEPGQFGRGRVVADPRLVRTTTRLDVHVEIRPAARRAVRSHTRIRVHLGTAEVLGKMIILEGAAFSPGSTGFAQLVLTEAVHALRGDRFVLRDQTARRTLGGGEVVNPFADRHRPGEAGLSESLAALRGGDAPAAALAFLRLSREFASQREITAQALNLDADESARALAGLAEVIPIPDARAPEADTTVGKWTSLEDALLAAVAATHHAEPLTPGADMERLRGQLPWEMSPKVFRWCVDRLVVSGRLVRDDSIVRVPEHRVALAGEARTLAARLTGLIENGGFTPPDLRQLEQDTGVERGRLVEVLGVLAAEGRLVRIAPDLFYEPGAAERAKLLIGDHCRAHGEITAAGFRDLIGASRKYAIAVLDWCDRTGVTVRVGDLRRLRR